MRIIGNIEHPEMKITIFKMNNKLSAKFEIGLFEQTYKFRESAKLNSFEDAERLVDEDFMKSVLDNFEHLQNTKLASLDRFFPKLEEEFEEII